MIPFYITQYITRRNRYCSEHLFSQKKDAGCPRCREQANNSRNKLTASQVELNERLNAAALLEYQVAEGTRSIKNARRKFVAMFPDTNVIPSSWDYVKNDSVLTYIAPYFDTEFTLDNKVTLRKDNEDNDESRYCIDESTSIESIIAIANS